MAPGGALGRRRRRRRLLRPQRPMIPWHMLRGRNIGLLFYVNFATGMAMYAVSLPNNPPPAPHILSAVVRHFLLFTVVA